MVEEGAPPSPSKGELALFQVGAAFSPADIDPCNDKPQTPAPRIPYDLILYAPTILKAPKADHAIEILAAACKVLNDKITLSEIVHFHSTESLKVFLAYYSHSIVLLLGTPEEVVDADDKKLREYDWFHPRNPHFLASPIRPHKTDKPFIYFTSTPATDTLRFDVYDMSVWSLRM